MNMERESDFERSILKLWFKNFAISWKNMNWIHSFDLCQVYPSQLLQQGREPRDGFESVRPKLIQVCMWLNRPELKNN